MNINCLDKNGETIYSFYQWDKNQEIYVDSLSVDTAPYFHFQTQYTDVPVIVRASLSNGIIRVSIPNVLLEEPYTIEGYIYVQENDGAKAIGVVRLPVRERQQPSDEEYVDNISFISLENVNKEIDRLTMEISTLLELTASDLFYDNSNSKIDAINVQDAIDEIVANCIFVTE